MKPATTTAALALGAIACAAASLALARPSASENVTAPPGVRVKLLGEGNGTRTFQLVFAPGVGVMDALSSFVVSNHFAAVHFEGLGACTDAVVAYYDPATHDYRKTSYSQQMEIVSLIGDAAPTQAGAGLHAHIGLGFADGTMHGGHLVEAHASPTLELAVTVSPRPLERAHDATLNTDLLVP